MEKIILFKPEIEVFFNELIFDLYRNEYFGYLEQAIAYKDKIIDFIDKNIASNFQRNTPFALISLGSFYIFYKSNKRTTWYVFLRKKTMFF